MLDRAPLRDAVEKMDREACEYEILIVGTEQP